MFSYSLDQLNEKAYVRFVGDLDIEVAELMETEIIPALQTYTNIEFDFQEVPFVDSTGIGLLLNLIETVKNNGLDVQVKIKNVQPLVKDVFDMLQLDKILGENVFV
ncbi:STAS domain-containing protein [Aeribacillus sp. FSL K6-1121]|uniref:STAS domain-containing protein n=1 Tax=Aeribacillus sp. FSL K6-1121 TaxID=2954745 RepID=UPI0030F7E776